MLTSTQSQGTSLLCPEENDCCCPRCHMMEQRTVRRRANRKFFESRVANVRVFWFCSNSCWTMRWASDAVNLSRVGGPASDPRGSNGRGAERPGSRSIRRESVDWLRRAAARRPPASDGTAVAAWAARPTQHSVFCPFREELSMSLMSPAGAAATEAVRRRVHSLCIFAATALLRCADCCSWLRQITHDAATQSLYVREPPQDQLVSDFLEPIVLTHDWHLRLKYVWTSPMWWRPPSCGAL